MQKKLSFWFKIGINYEISYLEPRLLLPPIAQLVEHQTSDQDVLSSSLTWGSILFYARLCTVIRHCVAEVINLIRKTFEQKNTLCHFFRIIVIPSVILSFLPNYFHSFWITVIPSELLTFVIPNSSCTLPYPKGEKIGRWCRGCRGLPCQWIVLINKNKKMEIRFTKKIIIFSSESYHF